MSLIDLEKRQALVDVRRTCREWGQKLKYFVRQEQDIVRGSLGSKINAGIQYVEVYTYPINRNPDQKAFSHAGLQHQGSALLYTSALEWYELGILKDLSDSPFDISRMTVGLDGREFGILEVGFAQRVGDCPLYVTFSLR